MINVYELTVGPIVKGLDDNTPNVNMWGRADKIPKVKKYLSRDFSIFLVLKINNVMLFEKVYKDDDYTGMINVKNLNPGIEYEYQMGYVILCDNDNINNIHEFDWNDIDNHKFVTYDNNKNLSFIFGSCRRYCKLGPFVLFGTGESADIIYGSIHEHKPDFFLSIGDQVYFDPFGSFVRIKKLNDMRKLYRKIRNFPQVKKLLASTVIYEMCDDHDFHRNDSNYYSRQEEPEIAYDGKRCYFEYQHFNHNHNHDKTKLWYIFYRDNATFFVMDTRSERQINKIISNEQLDSFIKWITDPENENRVKFVVTPTPLISQNENDSWYGFPEQQKVIINTILKAKKVFVLTGDAHCARSAAYFVNDIKDKLIIEILSSGLVAVNHDVGKGYNNIPISDYDNDNNFPLVITNNDMKFTTFFATKSYPSPNKPVGVINNIKHIYKRLVDNVFTKISINDNLLIVEIYNQDNILLDKIKYEIN